MRLLQAIAGGEGGGAEGFFVRLALALGEAGVDQTVLMRRHPQRQAALAAAGIATETLRFGGLFDPRTGSAIARIATTARPQLALGWMSRATAALTPARRRGRLPILCARLGGYYDPRHYRACDHLIANTDDLRDWLLARGFKPERVHTIGNFVDTERAVPIVRATVATPPDVPLIVALGRLHPNKAFDTLLRALPLVPRAHLWIAGDGPERKRLEKLALRLGLAQRIRWLGWRDDGAALIAAADLLVCPSRHEPLGNVVLEAWAQRVPVVAARSAGPAGLIEDGVSGRLVAVDDPDALAAAIQDLLADPALRQRLAANASAALAGRFARNRIVDAYLDLFQRLIDERA